MKIGASSAGELTGMNCIKRLVFYKKVQFGKGKY